MTEGIFLLKFQKKSENFLIFHAKCVILSIEKIIFHKTRRKSKMNEGKAAYEALEIEIIYLDFEDIITSSTCPNETEDDEDF